MRYVVGIDPGKRTGVAIYDRKGRRLVLVSTMAFWQAHDLLVGEYPPDIVRRVVVEVPDTRRVFHRAACSRGAIERTGVHVGGVVREAELLAEGIERLGHEVVRHRPLGKVDAQSVKRITGYAARTNQHERDAIMLCWGM